MFIVNTTLGEKVSDIPYEMSFDNAFTGTDIFTDGVVELTKLQTLYPYYTFKMMDEYEFNKIKRSKKDIEGMKEWYETKADLFVVDLTDDVKLDAFTSNCSGSLINNRLKKWQAAFSDHRVVLMSKKDYVIYKQQYLNKKDKKDKEMSKVTIPGLYEGLIDTYNKKNADYGNSFDKSLDKYGLISALTRMSDKFNRAETLILNGQKAKVADEKVEDTLLDLANYCVMTVAWMKNHKDECVENKD